MALALKLERPKSIPNFSTSIIGMILDADMVVRKCLQTIQKISNDTALLQCFEARVEQKPAYLNEFESLVVI